MIKSILCAAGMVAFLAAAYYALLYAAVGAIYMVFAAIKVPWP